jgi:hypothetical protein
LIWQSKSTALANFLSAGVPFRYLGETTITQCPQAANAIGKEPQTSPKPPVFEYGAASAVTKTILWVTLVLAFSSLPMSSASSAPLVVVSLKDSLTSLKSTLPSVHEHNICSQLLEILIIRINFKKLMNIGCGSYPESIIIDIIKHYLVRKKKKSNYKYDPYKAKENGKNKHKFQNKSARKSR